MNFGSNLSYNVRVTKRKFNKFRFFSVIFIFVMCIAGALFLFNSSIKSGINSIFSASHKVEVASKEKQDNNISNDSSNSTSKNDSTKQGSDKSGVNTTSNDASTNMQPKDKIVRDYSIIKSEIENYTKGFQGKYGVYFIDLDNGGEFGINDTDTYFAASTVKIPVNLYLFKKIQDGSINPDDVMTYNKSIDYETGTGNIQYKKNGSKFTIRELSELSITISDNVAVNMLIRLLGKQNYKDFMKASGGTVVTEKNVSSPKDMATYMKGVYAFQKSDEALGDELIGFFENTIYNERLPKLLPPEVKIAHKIGTFWGETCGNAIHDVGIVYGENDYIITVMSQNVKNETEGSDVIANISKKVYDFMAKKVS